MQTEQPVSPEDSLTKQANELKELVAQVRKEARLLPERPKRPIETSEESTSVKAQKTVFDDRAALMSRLKTFSTLYHCVHRPISALDCAKHGWQYKTAQDDTTAILTCADCHKEIYVIEIPTRYKHKLEAIKVVKYYQEGLFKCHEEECQWRYHSCKNAAYCFPLNTLREGLDRLQNEARAFSTVCKQNDESIPLLKHPLTTEALNKLTFVVEQFEKDKQWLNAYLLSLFGWTVLHPDIPGIQCDLCFSQRGFFQIEGQLDLLEEHKDYCPWRKGVEEGEPSGYEWMMDIVGMEYSLLIKRQDLSLASEFERDERFYRLKQTITQSQQTLCQWQARIDAVSKSKEL